MTDNTDDTHETVDIDRILDAIAAIDVLHALAQHEPQES